MSRATWAAAALAAVALAGAPGASADTWYAGDGHVHTCYSHDAYCPPGDDNTGPDTFYSSGGTVDQRFREAGLKGLDFLVISDHDDVRAQSDPAYGTAGVVGVPTYEASLAGGHAHMLGATRLYPKGDGGVEATRAMADALRADGGRFQANHPSYKAEAPFDSCDQAEAADTPLHWRYGFSVRPDSIEVWNATTLLQPAEIYWECWLQRGERVGATAGSDSHGATQPNIAMPTTWVLAPARQPADLLAAIEAGRTTLSRMPPSLGGVRLVIEGDADGDGDYEARIGDQVPPGAPLRIRAEGAPLGGLVRVRANGRTVADAQPLVPGGAVELTAPREGGWVRATLYLVDGTQAIDPGCMPVGQPIDTCSRDLAIAAMTSPIYAGAPAPEPAETTGPSPATLAAGDHDDEPDDDPPLPPVEQSNGAAPLPAVPLQRTRGAALSGLSARPLRRCGRRATTVLRVRWRAAGTPVQVQRRVRSRWRTVAARARGKSIRVRARCGAVERFRARTAPAEQPAGPWRRVTVRLR
jgi:hypothetical protein